MADSPTTPLAYRPPVMSRTIAKPNRPATPSTKCKNSTKDGDPPLTTRLSPLSLGGNRIHTLHNEMGTPADVGVLPKGTCENSDIAGGDTDKTLVAPTMYEYEDYTKGSKISPNKINIKSPVLEVISEVSTRSDKTLKKIEATVSGS